MLTHEVVCKDRASFGVGAETVEKRQHARFPPQIPTLFSAALHQQQLSTPQTRVQRQKRNITKALYVMLSTCIDFLFFGLYLTDNMKSLRHVMSGEASGIRSALPALLKRSAKKKENKDSWMKDCGKNLPVTNSFTPVVCLCTAPHFLPLCPGRCPVLIFLVCRNGPRIRERMRRWFLSLHCSSCVIRPRSDPTCPDVPPHPSSCTSVTHTLMYRWWRAVCKLA